MAEFEVSFASLLSEADQLNAYGNQISGISTQVRNVFNQTRDTLPAKMLAALQRSVVCSNINNCTTDMKNLSAALREAVRRYRDGESSLKPARPRPGAAVLAAMRASGEVIVDPLQPKPAKVDAVNGANGGAGTNSASEEKNQLREYFKQVAKKAGMLGAGYAIADAFQPLKWEVVLKNTYTIGKNARKIYKEINNMRKYARFHMPSSTNATVWGKKLVGWNSYFNKTVGTISKAKNLSTKFYNNFQKAWAHEVGVLKKGSFWLGTAVSAITNGITNYYEYKQGGIGLGRAAIETVTETVVDVGGSMLLTAGAAAAIGAVFGSAPVVAVAAVAIGAKIGADVLTKYLTNGQYTSSTEWLSDKVIDGVKAGYQALTNCAKTVKNGLSAAWKGLFAT